MFLVIVNSKMDDAWEFRATQLESAIGRKADRFSGGCETGKKKHLEFVWLVPTFVDALGYKAIIEAIEDVANEVSIREQ